MSNPSFRYQVYYTDEDKTPIVVPRSSVVTTAGDIVFIGKNRLEYGEVFNTNIVHLLEHFAAREDADKPNTPDLSQVYVPQLSKPTVGQIWYNKTTNTPHAWNGAVWMALAQNDTVAGNSGVIAHGQQLPRPVSSIDGYVYPYSECSWVVSPFGFAEPQRIIFLSCYTDSNARVFTQYRRAGSPTLFNGLANYQIIGIRDTRNHGVPFPTPNIPGLTPTPTFTPTLTPTKTPSVTGSPTPTLTRTPGQTRSATPTPTVTRSGTPVPSQTRSVTPTPTPTPTITPTITPSRPAPITVDLSNQTVARTTGVGSTLKVGYSILNTQLVVVYDSNGFNIPTRWLINDDPANYSVRATRVSGNVTPTGFLDTWLNCSINRTWEIQNSSTSPGTYTLTLNVQVRRDADNFVMGNGVIVLQVTVQ
ncbi:hypothetical protein Xoosp13_227 [Xanthomonas phage Xoo-sp13]|nr:hypothetical protein Xoosp13_227 [Xanthomonas phage Xoo-sp13]